MKTPAFAKAFAGRWRIAEMNVWDNGYLDFVERRTPPSKVRTTDRSGGPPQIVYPASAVEVTPRLAAYV